MPHSSGGGSSGGGFHGGSHSHGSSSGSSTPTHVVRHSYFAGSHRYVYYRRGRAYYYYSDLTPGAYRTPVREIALFVLFALVFLAFGVMMTFMSTSTPEMLYRATDTTVTVQDDAGVISNEAELISTMQAFADKTGIVPRVLTVNNSDWSGSLQNYAYNKYLALFYDECHWLLVYSCDSNGQNWHWEGMQGDETDEILHSDILNVFNKTVQKNLESNTPVGQSFNNAFNKILPDLMTSHTDFSVVLAAVIFLGVGIGIVVFCVYKYNHDKYFAEAERIPMKAAESTCEYCGGIYVATSSHRCPHCGASYTKSSSSTSDEGGTELHEEAPKDDDSSGSDDWF